jgi:hypothetical protein
LCREVQGHQRRGAGRIDGEGGALKAQRVGDPAGDDAAGQSRRDPELRGTVVLRADPRKDPSLLTAQRERVDAGVLKCLPGTFEQQPLLGVDDRRFAGGDTEELGIELAGVVEEAAVAGV